MSGQHDALLWAAAALQAACQSAYPAREADTITIGVDSRTVAQILDAADAALTPNTGDGA